MSISGGGGGGGGGGGESMYTETYYHMLYNNYLCIQFLCAGFSGVSDDSSQFHHISRHSWGPHQLHAVSWSPHWLWSPTIRQRRLHIQYGVRYTPYNRECMWGFKGLWCVVIAVCGGFIFGSCGTIPYIAVAIVELNTLVSISIYRVCWTWATPQCEWIFWFRPE